MVEDSARKTSEEKEKAQGKDGQSASCRGATVLHNPQLDPESKKAFKLNMGKDGKVRIKRTTLHISKTKKRLGGKVGKGLAHVNQLMLVNPTVQLTAFIEREPDVKTLDKISFMMGVSIICFSEFIFLKHPEWFPFYYQSLITLLIIMRAFFYFQSKAQFFLMDFCYAVNASCIAQTLAWQDNLTWCKLNYIFAMGPLCVAIPMWRNSLVFHSLDKITSIFMHGLPAIVFHLYRFNKIPTRRLSMERNLELLSVLPYALLFYAVWQGLYFFVTEVLFRQTFSRDKDLVTSLRLLAKDNKTYLVIGIRKILVAIGAIRDEEVLDPDEPKTKMIFACVQFAFTFITILPCPFLFHNERLSAAYLFVAFGIGMWNGASYYFEVFSRKYNQSLEGNGEEKSKVTPSASCSCDCHSGSPLPAIKT